jgi:tetratricopeptide (TPR) repeat protein
LIGEARHHISSNEDRSALNIYQGILKTYPKFADILFLTGSVYEKMGKIETAYSYLEEAYEECPINTNTILNLASIHQKYGNPEDSFHFYEKGIHLIESYQKVAGLFMIHEDSLKMKSNLALAYFQQGALTEVSC